MFDFKKLRVYIILLLFVPLHNTFANISHSKPAKYRVYHSAYCYNVNITSMNSLELNIPLPESWPEIEVSNIKIEGDNVIQLHNTEGPGRILRSYFTKGEPKKDTISKIIASYDIEVYEVNTDIEALIKRDYPPYEKNKEYEYYTIHPNEPEINEVADMLWNQSNNEMEFVKAAYEYIRENIKYESPSPCHSSLECLRMKKGACGRISGLFRDILRAKGVPARFVAGCWAGKVNCWHCWVEFKLPGMPWIPTDHSHGRKGLGFFSNNHIPLAKTGHMKFDTEIGRKACGFIQPGSWFFYYGCGSDGKTIRVSFDVESVRVDDKKTETETNSHIKKLISDAKKYNNDKKYYPSIYKCREVIESQLAPEIINDRMQLMIAENYFNLNKKIKSLASIREVLDSSENDSIKKQALLLKRKVMAEDVWLSDLAISRIKQGWGRAQKNEAVDHSKLFINKRHFEKGIGTHSASHCKIELKKGCHKFCSYVGINDNAGVGNGSVEFIVIGNGKEMWRSGVMKCGDNAKFVALEVDDIDVLELMVTDAGDGINYDHAVWADAKFIITYNYPTVIDVRSSLLLKEDCNREK